MTDDYPIDLTVKPEVTAFFEEATNTISYVVRDPDSDACAVIDSVLDFDYSAGRTDTRSADEIIANAPRFVIADDDIA